MSVYISVGSRDSLPFLNRRRPFFCSLRGIFQESVATMEPVPRRVDGLCGACVFMLVGVGGDQDRQCFMYTCICVKLCKSL